MKIRYGDSPGCLFIGLILALVLGAGPTAWMVASPAPGFFHNCSAIAGIMIAVAILGMTLKVSGIVIAAGSVRRWRVHPLFGTTWPVGEFTQVLLHPEFGDSEAAITMESAITLVGPQRRLRIPGKWEKKEEALAKAKEIAELTRLPVLETGEMQG